MSKRIVQLKDKNGNTAYPIAGGMIEDGVSAQMLKDSSVTTDKIADNAVSAEKINWSGLDNLGTNTVTSTTNGNAWVTTSYKTVISASLTAGTYFVMGSCCVNNSTAVSIYGVIKRNSNSGADLGPETLITVNNFYNNVCPVASFTLTESHTICVCIRTTSGTADLFGANSLSIIRVK